MGTDIYLFLEEKVCDYPYSSCGKMPIWRNFDMFSLLYEIKGADVFPLFPSKGFPFDASDLTLSQYGTLVFQGPWTLKQQLNALSSFQYPFSSFISVPKNSDLFNKSIKSYNLKNDLFLEKTSKNLQAYIIPTEGLCYHHPSWLTTNEFQKIVNYYHKLLESNEFETDEFCFSSLLNYMKSLTTDKTSYRIVFWFD